MPREPGVSPVESNPPGLSPARHRDRYQMDNLGPTQLLSVAWTHRRCRYQMVDLGCSWRLSVASASVANGRQPSGAFLNDSLRVQHRGRKRGGLAERC
jgi:hypothetical protein